MTDCIEPLLEKKLYFKVYQDSECINGCSYFVDTPENIMSMAKDWKESNEFYDEPFPVLEPIFMTEYEFNNLPEFTGY